MLNVTVIASGSSGNCYLLKSDQATIMLDCGLSFGKLNKLLNHKLPDYLFVTHEHCDHAKAASELISRGVDTFMTKGTAEALNLSESHHRLHEIMGLCNNCCKFELMFEDIKILAFKVDHDAAEPVGFTFQDADDCILYLIDTCVVPEIPYMMGFKFSKILIECNFERELLKKAVEDGRTLKGNARRVLNNHLDCKQVENFIEYIDKSALKEVHLIHISKRHGDAEKFQKVIENVTTAKVFSY